MDMWIEEKLIESRPDPRSKREEKEFMEYWYEEKFDSSTDVDIHNTAVTAEKEGNESSVAMTEDLATADVDAASSSTIVKKRAI